MAHYSDEALIAIVSAATALLGRRGIIWGFLASNKNAEVEEKQLHNDAIAEARQWYGDALEAMRFELDRFQSTVRDLSDENATLRVEVGKLTSENERLKTEMDEFRRENKKLRGEVSKLRNELDELKEENQ